MSPAAVLLAAAGAALAAGPARGPVRFASSDGVAIAADYRPPRPGKPVLVLLHGAGSARGEWRPIYALLDAAGWGALAIDARGHGESGGARDWGRWGREEWMGAARDMEAAAAWLERAGVPRRRVALGGASIGANLALAAAAREPRTPFVLLLSPGADYRGVSAAEALSLFGGPVLLAAAPDDPYSLQSARLLLAAARDRRSRLLEARSGHGVRMLEGTENAAFVRALGAWLRARWPG